MAWQWAWKEKTSRRIIYSHLATSKEQRRIEVQVQIRPSGREIRGMERKSHVGGTMGLSLWDRKQEPQMHTWKLETCGLGCGVQGDAQRSIS